MQNHMNKKIVSLAGAIGLALSAGVAASDYSFELGGQYVDFDFTEAWGADATVYFQPVQTGNGPLAEAPFLNRASNVSFAYLREKNGNFDVPAVGAEFYFGNYYLAANYTRFSNGFSINDYGIRGGLMVAESTRATIGYNRSELPFGIDLDTYTVGLKHLMLLDGNTALNLEGEVGVARNGSSEFAYAVQADYYLNPRFSLGGRYSGIGSDDEWGLGTRYFFTPRVSGGLEYTRADGNDIYGLRLAARF
jgi:hypothetical protein